MYTQRVYPRAIGKAFFLGSLVHAGLKILYSKGTLPQALEAIKFLEETERLKAESIGLVFQEDPAETVSLAVEIVKQYLRWAPKYLKLYDVLGVEIPVYVTAKRFTFVAYVDALVQDKVSGDIMIVEHKTCASLPSAQDLALVTQPIAYAWALQHADHDPHDVTGFVYNMLRKAAPHPPNVLKNGSLSKDKGQLTTKALYLREITARGLRQEDYADFLELLDDDKFNAHHSFYILDGMLAWWQQTLRSVAQEIDDTAKGLIAPLMVGDWMKCSRCNYAPLCSSVQQQGLLTSPYIPAELESMFYRVDEGAVPLREEE